GGGRRCGPGLYSATTYVSKASPGRSSMIIIIGAGITGLVLAHELSRRGMEYVVLEAASEPGGVIRTVEVEGRLYETGPQRTRLVPPVRALVEELGLEDELLVAPPGLPLLVHRSGRLSEVPFSVGAAF